MSGAPTEGPLLPLLDWRGLVLPVAPEAVISGINLGMNASLGYILGSGTIAGAWEGALHGLGVGDVSQVRVGKTIEFDLAVGDRAAAETAPQVKFT